MMESRHIISSAHCVRQGLLSWGAATLMSLAGCSDTDSMTGKGGPATTGGLGGGPPGGTSGASSGATPSGTGASADPRGIGGGGGLEAGVTPSSGEGRSAESPGPGAPANAGADGGASDAMAARDGGVGDADSTRGEASVAPAGDAGNGSTGACTRDLLQSTIDKYFVALAAHDSSMLPLAERAKFTENGVTMMVGSGGMWRTAGALKHEHSALDLQLCTSASQAVVPEGKTDLPFGLRLKLVNGKITEIEHIVVREGDYTILGLIPFASNPADIIASADRVKWKQPVSAAERTPRADMERWADKYFKMFPSGGCNLAPNCERRENGGGDFNCADALSCAAGDPPASSESSDPRLVVVDEDLGVAVAFAMFLGHTDMHMVKFRSGTVYAVHAILSAAQGPGWP